MEENKGVLVLYTGGTIGCVPGDSSDPESPLIVAPWDKFKEEVKAIELVDKSFVVDSWSPDEPIDSTNMEPIYWIKMVEVIEENYNRYEGFVILHGTDTMAYTAAALSFMLHNLSKPVILTGSQLPIIGRPRNDGEQNLITSLYIANPKFSKIPVVPEVCIFFRDKLLRGNRAKKVSASGYVGFDSPNYDELGEAGEHIKIHQDRIRDVPTRSFVAKKRLDTNVISFPIFPGIQSRDNKLLSNVLNLSGLKAVVLHAYGTGNAPTREDFLSEIAAATEKQIVIVDVSQCSEGMVELGVYETSVALLDRGVVSGSDITIEAALCKLMVLLGDEDLTTEEVKQIVQINLAGELSRSIYTTEYPKNLVIMDSKNNRHRIPGVSLTGNWIRENIELALLRLRSAEVNAGKDSSSLPIKIFINISSDALLDESKPNFVKTFKRQSSEVFSTLIFDITGAAKDLLSPGMKASFTIAIDDDSGGTIKWQNAEFVIYTKER